MDVVEREHTSLQNTNVYWNIPFISLLNHFNGTIKSRKMGPQGVLKEYKDANIITWVLNMQIVGLFITLQQLKLKVVEVTQTKPTPF
jgi:hypothetical protein